MSDAPVIPAPPMVDVRQQYVIDVQRTSGEKLWRKVHVDVYEQLADGRRHIYGYDRNYGMLHTFEPFRQLQGDTWHDYALISPDYGSFQVLDLVSGEVVADRGYEQRPWYRTATYDEYTNKLRENPEWFEPGGYYAGKGPDDTVNAEGFCPVDFYVPDFLTDVFAGDRSQVEVAEEMIAKGYDQRYLAVKQGLYAFYSGCYWGDDSSWKLRYIDLSRISEGIVTDEERFGYWALPTGRLRELVSVGSDGLLTVPREFTVATATGRILNPAEDMRWETDPELQE